jgi:RNA polymerase sigma factor (sigma-70 family)
VSAVASIDRVRAAPQESASEMSALLYERYSEQIFRYCLTHLRSSAEAEEALQTTFLCAHRALRRGTTPRMEAAWLFSIARNVCIAARRAAAVRGEREIADDPRTLDESVSARRGQFDELVGVKDVLVRMPESQRRAILLREWQGLSYREIAATLGLTQAAVETLIFRARRSLAQGLSGERHGVAWQRVKQVVDVGSLLAPLKALSAGSAATKIAAAATALTVTAALAGGATGERKSTIASAAAAPKNDVAHAAATRAPTLEPQRPGLNDGRQQSDGAKPLRATGRPTVERTGAVPTHAADDVATPSARGDDHSEGPGRPRVTDDTSQASSPSTATVADALPDAVPTVPAPELQAILQDTLSQTSPLPLDPSVAEPEPTLPNLAGALP